MVLALLLAYFFKGHVWKKAIIFVSAIPLSIITNSLRIAVTGILYESWGPAVAEGFFHGFSGWFIFMFSLAVLLLEMWILNFIGPRPVSTTKDRDIQAPIQPSSPNKGLAAVLHPPQFIVAVVLSGITLALSQGVEFREQVPVSKPLDKFPLTVGQWTGTWERMEQEFLDELDLSDYTIIDYKNGKGQTANFYVAYYESQRKGESIHSPATCLPGSGWVFNKAGGVSIPMPTAEGGEMRVNRAFMQKGDYKQLTYYWFPTRGRVLTNAYQLKIYNFWDALTRQRTDGALVRLITPVYQDEDLEDAEQRLQGFAQAIVPVLNEYLPD
jgi:exosortase D (VPLPA-CTERM-specific)